MIVDRPKYCNCAIKSRELKHHLPECPYRIMGELQAQLTEAEEEAKRGETWYEEFQKVENHLITKGHLKEEHLDANSTGQSLINAIKEAEERERVLLEKAWDVVNASVSSRAGDLYGAIKKLQQAMLSTEHDKQFKTTANVTVTTRKGSYLHDEHDAEGET